MVYIGRIEASRTAEAWGNQADTHENAMKGSLSGSALSQADSGTLLRIANALERIADEMDPESRAKKRKQQEEKDQGNKEYRERLDIAKAAEPVLQERLRLWTERNAEQLGRLPNKLREKLLFALRCKLRDYLKYGWDGQRNEFEAATASNIQNTLTESLVGIGPTYRARIEEVLTTAQTIKPITEEPSHEEETA